VIIRKLFCTAIIFTILLGLIGGCYPADKATSKESLQPAEDLKKDFKLNLYTDKNDYKQDEQIKIWAVLEYIGPDDQITIWHGDPYISFTITDGKNFNTGGGVFSVLTSTVLYKGKIYTFNYIKSGVYDNNSPDAAFWQEFYNQKELYLHKGSYTIKVQGAFSINESGNNVGNNLFEETNINVN